MDVSVYPCSIIIVPCLSHTSTEINNQHGCDVDMEPQKGREGNRSGNEKQKKNETAREKERNLGRDRGRNRDTEKETLRTRESEREREDTLKQKER